MKEEWKDIKEHEGLYQISNLGRVKRNYCGKHPVTGEKLKWKYIEEVL